MPLKQPTWKIQKWVNKSQRHNLLQRLKKPGEVQSEVFNMSYKGMMNIQDKETFYEVIFNDTYKNWWDKEIQEFFLSPLNIVNLTKKVTSDTSIHVLLHRKWYKKIAFETWSWVKIIDISE